MKAPSDRTDRARSKTRPEPGHGLNELPVRGRVGQGRAALEQARLIMLVMINIAQLWILAATIEAALAGRYQEIWALIIASGVCWLISLSIIFWWRPASRRFTSTGYLRDKR